MLTCFCTFVAEVFRILAEICGRSDIFPCKLTNKYWRDLRRTTNPREHFEKVLAREFSEIPNVASTPGLHNKTLHHKIFARV